MTVRHTWFKPLLHTLDVSDVRGLASVVHLQKALMLRGEVYFNCFLVLHLSQPCWSYCPEKLQPQHILRVCGLPEHLDYCCPCLSSYILCPSLLDGLPRAKLGVIPKPVGGCRY